MPEAARAPGGGREELAALVRRAAGGGADPARQGVGEGQGQAGAPAAPAPFTLAQYATLGPTVTVGDATRIWGDLASVEGVADRHGPAAVASDATPLPCGQTMTSCPACSGWPCFLNGPVGESANATPILVSPGPLPWVRPL